MFIAQGCQPGSAEAGRRIRICLDCHRACLDAAGACRGHDGPRAAMPLARAILDDCSQACLIAADFMARMTSLHAEVCGVCAAVCEACAEHCERAEAEVPGMRGCAEACRPLRRQLPQGGIRREAASIGSGRAELGGGGRWASRFPAASRGVPLKRRSMPRIFPTLGGGVYRRWILPRLIDWTMRAEDLAPFRRRLVRPARGRVIEVGIGSGLNLPFYGSGVEAVIGLDPSAELLRRAAARMAHATVPFHLLQASAEAIPLADRSVDTVVVAWTLCSLADARAGLGEMKRAQALRGDPLRRARVGSGSGGRRLAAPLRSSMDPHQLPPRQSGGPDAARSRVRGRRTPLRLPRKGTEADDLHVRRAGAAGGSPPAGGRNA